MIMTKSLFASLSPRGSEVFEVETPGGPWALCASCSHHPQPLKGQLGEIVVTGFKDLCNEKGHCCVLREIF